MDLSSDDLEDCMEKFRNTFLNHKTNRRNEEDLLLLVERLSDDLKLSRQNEQATQRCLSRLLENKTPNISTKYINMEGKYLELEAESIKLRKEVEELNTQLPRELETQKNEYERKLKEEREQSNLEMINMRNQLESDKMCYETKESEFQNELQAVQAAADLRCDEIESNLQRQLVDANSKLRQAQSTMKSLQLEINTLKMQSIQQKCNTTPRNNVLYFRETPIQPIRTSLALQHSVPSTFRPHDESHYGLDNNGRPSSTFSGSSRATEVVLHESPRKVTEKTDTALDFPEELSAKPRPKTKVQSARASGCTPAKYPPLTVDYFSSCEDDMVPELARKIETVRRPVLYKGTRQAVPKQKNAKNSLSPCTNKAKGKKASEENQPRKRKLYNPDDLEYLQSLMESDG